MIGTIGQGLLSKRVQSLRARSLALSFFLNRLGEVVGKRKPFKVRVVKHHDETRRLDSNKDAVLMFSCAGAGQTLQKKGNIQSQ